MKLPNVVAATLCYCLALASNANGTTLYSNDFDAENAGVSAFNYTGFRGLSLERGTVDLVRDGDFGVRCSGGHGMCVDLVGACAVESALLTEFYQVHSGERISWSFDASGNQVVDKWEGFFAGFHMADNILMEDIILGGEWGNQNLGDLYTSDFAWSSGATRQAGFGRYSIDFTAGHSTLVRAYVGADPVGHPGPVADNLRLTSSNSIPEPATWVSLILGQFLAGAALRRRRTSVRSMVTAKTPALRPLVQREYGDRSNAPHPSPSR